MCVWDKEGGGMSVCESLCEGQGNRGSECVCECVWGTGKSECVYVGGGVCESSGVNTAAGLLTLPTEPSSAAAL